MSQHHRGHAEWLTEENWRTTSRTRVSAGIWMGCSVHPERDGFRVIYGCPENGFGSVSYFATLEEALRFANTDSGGILLWFNEDRRTEARFHLPPPEGDE